MKAYQMKDAKTSELIARYARLRVDKARFKDLLEKATKESDALYSEMMRERGLKNGLYILEGREVVINFSSMEISTPEFKDVNNLIAKEK